MAKGDSSSLSGDPEKSGTNTPGIFDSSRPSTEIAEVAAAKTPDGRGGAAAVRSQLEKIQSAREGGAASLPGVYPSKPRRLLAWIKHIVLWSPKRTRYDPENPPQFTLALNIVFSVAGTVTVANLYYNQPILYKIAETFEVTFEKASSVATLMQAGYASGLLLLCPLGDVFQRRLFIISLVAFTSFIWLGLCLTTSFDTFRAISFLCGFTTVTPQLMLPLVGEMAPPHRRASALSVVSAGLSLGLMTARVLSGIISNYTHWRNIYWVGLGLQQFVLVSLYFYMPDYPSLNPDGLNYFRMLWSIVTIYVQEPILVQASLIALALSAVFTSYWTTLSFLLSSPPYSYTSLAIGFFGLIGFFVIFWGPIFGRLVLDRLTPLVPCIVGILVNFTGVTVGTWTGTRTVAGPIVQAILMDVSNQASNISLRTAILTIQPRARNRVNTAFMLAAFTGQMTGTAVANRLYAMGGWTKSGSAAMGFLGFAFVMCLVRGPRETGWLGWGGGWSPWRDEVPQKKPDVEQPSEPVILEAGPPPPSVDAESQAREKRRDLER